MSEMGPVPSLRLRSETTASEASWGDVHPYPAKIQHGCQQTNSLFLQNPFLLPAKFPALAPASYARQLDGPAKNTAEAVTTTIVWRYLRWLDAYSTKRKRKFLSCRKRV